MQGREGLHKEVTSNIEAALNFPHLSHTQILVNTSKLTFQGCKDLSALMDK
jgi:hypothetical protein